MEQRIADAIRELEQMDEEQNLPEPLYRISAENGQLLNLLVRVSGAKRVLEVGSSSGYSGLYLGEAARTNGGLVTTCEVSKYKVELARSMYAKAGLSETISIVEGNALETLKTLQGPWDFVFIDAWKDDYPAYLDLVWPHVTSGGIVAADDIISTKESAGIKEYLQKVRAKSDARTVTVPIDDGIELTTKL